jgi:hypothetical protein
VGGAYLATMLAGKGSEELALSSGMHECNGAGDDQ